MESYSSFLSRTLVKECLPLTRVLLLQFPILSFSRFVTITDSIDVYYYLFDGEQVPQQKELAQNGRALTSHERGTRSNTQILQSLWACNSFLPKEEYVEINRIL